MLAGADDIEQIIYGTLFVKYCRKKPVCVLHFISNQISSKVVPEKSSHISVSSFLHALSTEIVVWFEGGTQITLQPMTQHFSSSGHSWSLDSQVLLHTPEKTRSLTLGHEPFFTET